jgi:hypothetical protein
LTLHNNSPLALVFFQSIIDEYTTHPVWRHHLSLTLLLERRQVFLNLAFKASPLRFYLQLCYSLVVHLNLKTHFKYITIYYTFSSIDSWSSILKFSNLIWRPMILVLLIWALPSNLFSKTNHMSLTLVMLPKTSVIGSLIEFSIIFTAQSFRYLSIWDLMVKQWVLVLNFGSYPCSTIDHTSIMLR